MVFPTFQLKIISSEFRSENNNVACVTLQNPQYLDQIIVVLLKKFCKLFIVVSCRNIAYMIEVGENNAGGENVRDVCENHVNFVRCICLCRKK